MSFSLWNDQIVKNEEVLVDKEDRGYQFGDGVYEVVKVYNGELFTATEHIDRFYSSAEKSALQFLILKINCTNYCMNL